MKVYITEVNRYFFKKTDFKKLRMYDEWKHNILPIVGDILYIDGCGYKVVNRTFYCPNEIQLYVEKIY